jgi:hypothetical protein
MSTTVSSPQISAAIHASLAGGAAPAITTSNVIHDVTEAPTVGSATGNVNKVYSAPFTIAASGTPTSIDLSAATDPLGNALNFGTIHAIIVENLSVTPGEDITIGAGTNGVVASVPLIAYGGAVPGWLAYNAGSTGLTVDATHKIITLTAAAGTNVAGKITVIGK